MEKRKVEGKVNGKVYKDLHKEENSPQSDWLLAFVKARVN